MNRSPTRYEFNIKRYRENLAKDPNDITAKGMINHYLDYEEQDKEHAVDPEWCKDNLEYDLRTTEWIIEKAKCDKVYAQHLYAAICNNDFTRNDVWPILTEKKWSSSWRHAGGIIADMREEGDYMSWYCSGIVDIIINAHDIKTVLQHIKTEYCQINVGNPEEPIIVLPFGDPLSIEVKGLIATIIQ